jgi:dolichol-phosphate mannosyltransferase
MSLITVVIPVYDEEDNIRILYDRLKAVLTKLTGNRHDMIFVNDGSTDSSLNIIQSLAASDPCVKYIDLSKNFGHQNAVFAGMDHAEGEAVVIIDSDLQDPPETIEKLYNKFQEGFDVVYAQRSSRSGENWHKLLTAKYFYRIINRLSEVQIPLDTGDFRIISQRVCRVVCAMPERNKFLRGQIAWTGFNQTYIEYDRSARNSGDTKYSYRKMLRFAMDGITSFTNIPLKAATWLGFFTAGIAVIMFLRTIYVRLVTGDFVKGWPSLMVTILFLGGVQLICIGILGEYLGRILDNVRGRPNYIIRDTNLPIKPPTTSSTPH